MTFASQETSRESGRPVELFLFELGTERFAYTNGEDDITFETVEYIATSVTRSKVVASTDNKDAQVNIKLPGDNSFARLYIGVIPGEFPEITVRQLHRDDPDDEAIFVFEGFVSTVAFVDDLRRADIACRPLTSASGRLVPRQTFQGLCNHTLYDPRCTEPEADNQETGTVTAASGRNVTISGLSNTVAETQFWLGGFVEFGAEFRTIMVQADDVMTLDIPFLENPVGASVRVLPGCDHLIGGDCLNTFGTGPDGNTINHSGFPYVAQKNPFQGLD